MDATVHNRRLETLQVHRGIVAPGLARQAKRFGCSRSDLCTAILLTVFQAKLVDSILDGDQPGAVLDGALRIEDGRDGPRLRLPLRGRHKQVFDWLCSQTERGSLVTFMHADLARELDLHLTTVNSVLQSFARHGLIEQVTRGVRGKPGSYRVLTAEGV